MCSTRTAEYCVSVFCIREVPHILLPWRGSQCQDSMSCAFLPGTTQKWPRSFFSAVLEYPLIGLHFPKSFFVNVMPSSQAQHPFRPVNIETSCPYSPYLCSLLFAPVFLFPQGIYSCNSKTSNIVSFFKRPKRMRQAYVCYNIVKKVHMEPKSLCHNKSMNVRPKYWVPSLSVFSTVYYDPHSCTEPIRRWKSRDLVQPGPTVLYPFCREQHTSHTCTFLIFLHCKKGWPSPGRYHTHITSLLGCLRAYPNVSFVSMVPM